MGAPQEAGADRLRLWPDRRDARTRERNDSGYHTAGATAASCHVAARDNRWVPPRALNARPDRRPGGKPPMLFRDLEEHRDYRYSVLVTNHTVVVPKKIWRIYRLRAKEENAIEERKEGDRWREFNVHSFSGTEAAICRSGWRATTLCIISIAAC